MDQGGAGFCCTDGDAGKSRAVQRERGTVLALYKHGPQRGACANDLIPWRRTTSIVIGYLSRGVKMLDIGRRAIIQFRINGESRYVRARSVNS